MAQIFDTTSQKMSGIKMALDSDDLSIDPLRVLWCGRLHPALNPLWTSIFGPINISLCCLFTALAIEGILVSYNSNIFFMSECLQTCILMLHTIGILITLRTHKPTLLKLLEQKSQFWKLRNFDGDVYDECFKIQDVVKKMLRCYYCLNFFVCIFFDMQPFFTGYLPTACYVPEGWFNYLSATLWYLSFMVLLTLPGTDSFFCSLATSLIIQFKMLDDRFKTIKIYENGSDPKLWIELKKLIKYHKFLLSYCEELNASFRSLFLIQFLVSIASGSVSVFIFTQPGAWINRIKFLLYFVATTIESAFYFVPLEYVVKSAIQVGDSVYESKWYNIKDLQIKKCLTLVIARSQKSVIFSAYGLIWMNLRTFLVMCKTMFSFYTYLDSSKKYRTD